MACFPCFDAACLDTSCDPSQCDGNKCTLDDCCSKSSEWGSRVRGRNATFLIRTHEVFDSCLRFFLGPISMEHIRNKQDFITFMRKACYSKATTEYRLFYKFLLKAFRHADRDFDGLVGKEDFEIMMEMVEHLEIKFGFMASSVETNPSTQKRAKQREKLFKAIDVDKDGKISFNEWLDYNYSDIKQKLKTANYKRKYGEEDQDHFKDWVVEACQDRKSKAYKDLYNFLLESFVNSDLDQDGLLDFDEFDRMIKLASWASPKFGTLFVQHDTAADRRKHHRKMFKSLDPKDKGFVTFQDWLTYCYHNIFEKAKTLDASLCGKAPPKIKNVQQKDEEEESAWDWLNH